MSNTKTITRTRTYGLRVTIGGQFCKEAAVKAREYNQYLKRAKSRKK